MHRFQSLIGDQRDSARRCSGCLRPPRLWYGRPAVPGHGQDGHATIVGRSEIEAIDRLRCRLCRRHFGLRSRSCRFVPFGDKAKATYATDQKRQLRAALQSAYAHVDSSGRPSLRLGEFKRFGGGVCQIQKADAAQVFGGFCWFWRCFLLFRACLAARRMGQ